MSFIFKLLLDMYFKILRSDLDYGSINCSLVFYSRQIYHLQKCIKSFHNTVLSLLREKEKKQKIFNYQL